MQSKNELEQWYQKTDPWGYLTNTEDSKRKQLILSRLKGRYKKALDIGCGEGFITTDLPADEIHGLEISDLAASRFPTNVKRVFEPDGKYDLIVATGVMYKQYDYQKMIDWIKKHATGTVLLSNIKSWEMPEVHTIGKQIYEEEYSYREYTQKLRIYDLSATQSH